MELKLQGTILHFAKVEPKANGTKLRIHYVVDEARYARLVAVIKADGGPEVANGQGKAWHVKAPVKMAMDAILDSFLDKAEARITEPALVEQES